MSRFDLVSLRLFLSAVETGAIVRAAELHDIAPSAVSKRIADLEHAAGAPLLYRRQRGVEATSAGRALARHARSLLGLVERMEGELSAFTSGTGGLVRLSANTSAVTQFLPGDLDAFLRHCPDVRIDLREETSEVVLAAIQDGLADMGICSDSADAGDLQLLPYRSDRLGVIAPKGHPLAEAASGIAFAATLDHDHVGLQAGSALRALLWTKAAALEQVIGVRAEVSSLDAVCRMVAAGLGIAVLPLDAAAPYLDTADLVAIDLTDDWAERSLNIAVREVEALPLVARNLIAHLQGHPLDEEARAQG
ncbi:MAG: LysR family transcriptional regulator [Methyloligellaceae bacterium]